MKEFTQFNQLVVKVIIGLLCGYISPKYFPQLEKSKIKAAKIQINALEKTPPADTWGNPYIYKSPGDYAKIDISSYGADGRSGESDEYSDITNWQ